LEQYRQTVMLKTIKNVISITMIIIPIFFPLLQSMEKRKPNQANFTIPLSNEGCIDQNLHSAASYGCVNRVRELLAEGANINDLNELRMTPLASTLIFWTLNTAKLLLEEGADPNIKYGKRGETVLIKASYFEQIDMVKMLLAYNADPNLLDKNNHSALCGAVSSNNVVISKLLLKYGANIHGNGGVSPITYVVSVNMFKLLINNVAGNGTPMLLRRIIKAGMPIETLNHKGYTSLMCAVVLNRLDNMKVLIAAGVNVNTKNERGETAISIAIEENNQQIIDYLIKSGAQVE